MPAASWLAERYGVHRVFATSLAIWSIATLAAGFAQGFLALLILRVLLGVGESVTFPCASKVLAGAVPVAHLGLLGWLVILPKIAPIDWARAGARP